MNIKNHEGPRLRNLGLVLIVIASLSFTSVTFASPIDDKRKKAEQLSNQIQANGDKISGLAESYNATTLKLASLKTDVQSAQNEIDAAELENKAIDSRVQKRAISLYTSSANEDDVDSTPLNAKRKDSYANLVNGSDSFAITQLQISKENIALKKAELSKQLVDIDAQEKALSAQKKSLEAANASQLSLLNQTKGELSGLIAQKEAADQAAARARAAATVAATPRTSTNTSKKTGGTVNNDLPTNLPAPSPKASIAIEFARQQLGKPYVWAATGPNSYDCSGLTMRAWGAAGVGMPHYSGAQYAMFPKVQVGQLQPGDLVFRGAGGSQHVGLYIGNGLMIAAPQTGDVVKISSIGRTIGGARPG